MSADAAIRPDLILIGRSDPTKGTHFIVILHSNVFYYFCRTLSTGPIVQWIEFQIPVLTIWVRIPVGSQKN